jgi:hypothetical protein
MLLYQAALVSEISAVSASQLLRVGAALQKQVSRDFGPAWNVQATVSAFTRLEDVPLGAWPVIVRDDIDTPGAAGVHEDKDGQPFALVAYSSDWPLTASHECLEMLADPFGSRLIAGRSVKRGQGRVEYLVEVCDPCEDIANAYTVNGILLSDFYTPHYFEPVKSAGVRYSFTGAITHPHEVLKGGYLSWHDPATGHWWQLQFFGARKTYHDLGVLSGRRGSLRSIIDSLTPRPEPETTRAAVLGAEAEAEDAAAEGPNPKAQSWREQIDALKRGASA